MANQPRKVAFFKDFTGGLNLKSQRQDLLMNETPDCLNIDFDQRGGLVTRNGISQVSNDANMGGLTTYLVGQYSFGTEKLWGVSNAGRLWTWDGTTATHVATAITTNVTGTERVRGETWTTKLYFANAYNGGSTLVMRTWNDAAYATLGNVVNNNYTAPTGGNAPLARLICGHGGYMWWGDTVEAGTRFRSRIRFSHPLQPEDFATADYFDIEPDDQTDQITALVTFRGQLLVFKKRAVYAVYGSTRDDFVVERLSATTGTVSQESVSTSPDKCFWWSPDGDVMAYDGKTLVSIGQPISTLTTVSPLAPWPSDLSIKTKKVISTDPHNVVWAERKLYILFAIAGIPTSKIVYVFDPYVGARGAWTRYSFYGAATPQYPTSMVWWRRASRVNGVIFAMIATTGVFDLNVTGVEADILLTPSTTRVSAYYSTPWFSADDTALKKRWKRMSATASCNDFATLNVDVFNDFDETTVRKTLSLTINPAGTLLWGGGTWGGGLWSANPTDTLFAFDRLQSVGRGHAVRFKFYVNDNTTRWTLDSFALPFIEKAYR